MKLLLSSLSLMQFVLVGSAAAVTPDTQWTYKTIDGQALKMDVFLPVGHASEERRFPAILFFHGGSWSGGKVSWHHPDCAYWSKRGMIAVSVDYRLKKRDQVEVPLECVKDAKSAVRFLRKNADKLKVDVDKMVVAGGSAGGQMAAAVAMIDEVNDANDDLAISGKPNAAVLYNPYFKCEESLRPPNFVAEGLPPMISFLGSKDPSVSVESLKDFHEDLLKSGNNSELYIGKGGRHGFCIGTKAQNRFFYWSLELVDTFLVKHGILTGHNLVTRPEGVERLKPNEFEAYQYAEPQVRFSSSHSVYLHNNRVSDTQSDTELVIERGNTKWKGGAALSWEVEIPRKDGYEVYLIASVGEDADGTKLSMETAAGNAEFTLSQTSGPFPGGENFTVSEALNFERVKLPGSIEMEAGKQIISVASSGTAKEGSLFHFRSFELLPLSKKEMIAKEEARAKNARASVDWLVEAGYGLMFHWTSGTPQPDGSRKTYEDAVNDFDVEQFSNMVEETGAGYVLFTVGHAESYCPAPLKSWERIHPGHTTRRDLIAEMANALNEKGIRLMCYINGPLGLGYPRRGEATPEVQQAFVANYNDVLTELGMRYQDKIAGYWFDTMISIFKDFPELPFEDLFHAAKVGNKNRIICHNAWIWPDVSPWQDYWPGEVQHPIAPPKNGFMINGPSPDLPYHVLLTMEKHSWGARRSGIKDPKFTSQELSLYIKACMENGGAVTINMSIFQDGTVGKNALQVMREVKERIR